MRGTTVVALCAAIACGCSAPAASDAPRIELGDMGMTLHLTKPMQQALDSLAPSFAPIKPASFRSDVAQAAAGQSGGSLPALFATVGDFDGDGTQDAVVEGTKQGDTGLTVIAVLNGAAPRAIEVTRFPEFDADAVGVYLVRPPAGRPGAFEVVNYPEASSVYSWRDGAFQPAAAP